MATMNTGNDIERQFEAHPKVAGAMVYRLRLSLIILGIILFLTGAFSVWIYGILSWNS
jgi:hypothetical protein